MGRGAWRAAVHRVTKSRTRLKRLSTHAIYIYIHTHTHTQWNITHRFLKNEILPFATMWIDLESIMLVEISQRKTKALCVTYIWNLKIK